MSNDVTAGPAAAYAAAAAAASEQTGQAIAFHSYGAFGAHLQVGRFVLQNGLRILIAPDSRAPLFSYQTWFAVGSKHEPPQRTGLAHLFEHLMFKGTENFKSGVFDKEMERRGAQTNAATWVDWTYYTEALTTRADNFATVIRFEADRMSALQLDAETFRSELEVVKNERRMTVDNAVTGLLSEALLALVYQTHPYRWPTIGHMAHLEAMTLADAQSFYKRHYGPDNAVIVVVGDVQPKDVLSEIAQAYGHKPKINPPRWTPRREAPQTAPRLAYLDYPVLSPQLLVGYRAPAVTEPGALPAEVAAEILLGGETGRLYRRLMVQERLVSDVSGALTPFAEDAVLEIALTVRPGVDPLHVLDRLQAALDEVSSTLNEQELHKAQHNLELSALSSLRDVEGCAELLGHYEITEGDFSRGLQRLAGYRAVQLPEVAATCARMFQPSQRSCVIARAPQDGDLKAHA